MEAFIAIGLIILVIYQIYSTDKNVHRLLKEVRELKKKIEELKDEQA